MGYGIIRTSDSSYISLVRDRLKKMVGFWNSYSLEIVVLERL